MSAPAALLSSEKFDWQTPDWFLELVKSVAPIALDPATAPNNPTGAAQFFTPEEDGLQQVWKIDVPGLVFCNCPYGQHLSGPIDPKRQIIRKGELIGVGTGWAVKMSQYRGQALYLLPTRTETDWWKRMFHWSDQCLLWSSSKYGRRINFRDPSGRQVKNGSTIASTVFYRGDWASPSKYAHSIERFREVFRPHGTLIKAV